MNKSKEEIEFRILESKGKALLDREINGDVSKCST
ncbi:hypothetical protein Wxf_01385 [Wolbachia endosymbiont of Armadillidium vulgare]|nr:hypothetical protein Wxf_00069 [Wolbachia endosymbiont of Armadillidium vulgare]OJH31952.1 hypothetical protein Wxf_01370 [Wolbachia endosymbiont of Armadillidium vulgare]OJH31967.1 hypothetical protein Wxf_01385 [Wolbachia endosymbiont of Armadillidium vulgare]